MESKFTNTLPVSAHAAAGVCAVLPAAHFGAASPAAVRSLAARIFPQVDWTQNLIIMPTGSYLVQEKPSRTLGGFRGVPPRGRPV